jgi:hypothetical protein
MYIFIFTFMLRFSVDFLWISVSEWAVRFSLCFKQKYSWDLTFPPWALPHTSFYIRCFRKVLFLSAQQVMLMFLCSNHGSQVVCQTLMTNPNISGRNLWFPLKRTYPCAPELLLGTAEFWEGLPNLTWLLPPEPGC